MGKFIDVKRNVLCFAKGIVYSFKIAGEESYFPEKERKGYFLRLNDNFKWVVKNNNLNTFYCLYGLDVKNNENNSSYLYIGEKEFWKTQYKLNRVGDPSSQIYYLRDKYAFYFFMKSHDIKVPEVFYL